MGEIKNSKYHNQLKTFLRLLEAYQGEEGQLSRFLPSFFRNNRQMGSGDRKTASRLIYNYFRIGKAAQGLKTEERLFLAEFLCNNTVSDFLAELEPELNSKVELGLAEKISELERGKYNFNLYDVFPFHSHLSEGIDKHEFLKSFFVQPDLFIRIHPGKEKHVKSTLAKAGVPFEESQPFSLRLPNGTKLDQLFPASTNTGPGYEVQDLSSQLTGKLFKPAKYESWWDCCAASGGKSLLLFHQEPEVKLLVSDLRDTILDNLDNRFREAGLIRYQKKVLDLTKDPQPFMHNYHFDGIILDAPCSGSGTWGRTPELISQFRESKISAFQRLQRSIASNVVKYLKPGKPLIYITCSVFREENEDNIQYLIQNFNLELESQEIIRGYDKRADTMFAARLISKD